MLSLLIIYLCLSLTLGSCIQLFRTRYRRSISRIPGPFIASFSNLWKFNAVYHGDMPKRNVAAHEKYGPVVRIGPNHVSFASPQALNIIHGSRTAYAKSDFYKPTTPVYNGAPLPNLFSLQDINHHARLKRNIAGLYTKAAVRDLEPLIDSCTMLLMKQFARLSESGLARVDMSLWLHLYAFDCLGEINLSKKFGFLESGTDVRGMIAATDGVLNTTGLLGQAPTLQRTQTLIRRQKFFKAIWGVKRNNPLLMYALAQIKERQQNPTPAPDMLNKFLELRESQTNKISIKELQSALYINLMAGHDVLAITLRTIFYNLAHVPRVLSRLRAEIKSAEKDCSPSDPMPYSHVATFSYLDAVIHEALRIHPNTGLILERIVPAGGATIDGYLLPAGTVVGVNAFVIHKNQEIYGEDVDVFRPERWLNPSQEKVLEMKRNLLSFGAGPRSCIGRNIAWLQLSKLVVEFYRRFDAALVDPGKEWHVHGSWVTKQTEMDMFVSPLREGEEIA